jgi:hypothetical protein
MDTMRTGMGAEAITANFVGAIAPSSDLAGSERGSGAGKAKHSTWAPKSHPQLVDGRLAVLRRGGPGEMHARDVDRGEEG